jgi:curved DNA-binding protein CbpA
MRTLYDVLGVRPDVDGEAIRLAFRTLAKAWHPDANIGDRWSEQRFKQITAAYTTLGHPQTRAAYDERLAATRRRRKRRILEVIYCVAIAIVSFALEKTGIELYREISAESAPAVATGEPVVTGALADRQPSGIAGTWPTGRQPGGQRRSARPRRSAAARRSGAGDTSGNDPNEYDPNGHERSACAGGRRQRRRGANLHGAPGSHRPTGRRQSRRGGARKVEIRVWTVGRDHGGPRRFMVERERPSLERSSDAAMTRR